MKGAGTLAAGLVLVSLLLVDTVPAREPPLSKARPPSDAAPGSGARTFRRGMTVSCPGYGRIWGSPLMAEALDELGALGVGWVALHPYAGVRRDGSVRFDPAAGTGYLDRSVELARERGIELFWKPHLAYWGSFEWRGAIEFGADSWRWERFFAQYREFILDQARFAERHRLPLLSVGVELEATVHREAAWRRIIADVRAVYSGPLTYAANWDRVGQVPFWDALDLIGVQAYFPLSAEASPSEDDLRRGWEAPLAQLRELSERHGKPVLFTEIGYDFSPAAALEPWAGRRQETDANRALRRRLIAVALDVVERQPFVEGLFWWKWIPGPYHAADDFSMRHDDAVALLRSHWSPAARITAR